MEVESRPTFDAFIAARGTSLLRHAYVLTGDRYLAEDLVQEVLAHLYRRWDRVVATTSPEAYVKASVTRQFLSWRRRRWFGERPTDEVPESDAAIDGTGSVDDDDVLWRLLARLPKRQRAILALRFYDDQSDEQIAAILGVSASTVRSNASRGLATLRSQLDPSDVTGGVS